MAQVLHDFLLSPKAFNDISNVERKKHLQKLRIIRHLYLNTANTNAEICSTFNFSLPTSMALINQLIAGGIVDKQGRGESVGGRKPDLYGLKKNTFFVLSIDRKSTRLNSSHVKISYAVFCLKKKRKSIEKG